MGTQPFNAAAIHAEAERRAGFADSEREVFAGNLEALVDGINRDARLNETGVAITRELLITNITHRLQGLKWVAEYPEILAEEIDSPVFLTGLPRSGTTYFQYLFDRDTRFRLIRTWEANDPSPPPGADPESVRRRIAEEVGRTQAHRDLVPDFDAMHLTDPTGSEECHMFLSQTFSAVGFHNFLNVPTFFDAVMDHADFAAAYRVHKRQLQLLQWRGPKKPWALKYPNHVVALDKIMEVHPDARFVMTHRDPVQVLASICRLTHTFRAPRSEGSDPKVVGAQMLHFISRHIDGIMRFDATPDGARVAHIDYYRLVEEPMAEMERAHAGLGIDTPDAVRDAVTRWRQENPKGKRGSNPYALADYGLDGDEVAERFGDYMRRFDIPREAQGLARAAA